MTHQTLETTLAGGKVARKAAPVPSMPGGSASAAIPDMPALLQGRIALSISDAATTLGVGRTTIYGMINRSALDTLRIGRRNLVLVSSVARLLEEAQSGQ